MGMQEPLWLRLCRAGDPGWGGVEFGSIHQAVEEIAEAALGVAESLDELDALPESRGQGAAQRVQAVFLLGEEILRGFEEKPGAALKGAEEFVLFAEDCGVVGE